MGLTAKQRRFVQEYLIDLNATAAAIRAGYSERTASVIGCQNLRKLQISAAIAEAAKERAKRVELSSDRVLEEIARVAFADIRRAFDADGNLLAIDQMPEEIARAVAGFEVVEHVVGAGDDRTVERTKKVKITDKLRALELAGRHLKLFTDVVEHRGDLVDAMRRARNRAKRSD